ncbi:signal recognition particle-docking protein FtsY [Neptunomonas marina]|uniref:Signal recognition particle receptor FtsY n=1 Tax=Neptunomonas marina TaxID=1815562 RepID=A0A437QD90_9GAMM|nr:signal recognition particle-docking protein FtsY [Neptunomonas marina]RVU32353.1 signal recognition particle-docking protein FtsY [Neptunomonas marina]
MFKKLKSIFSSDDAQKDVSQPEQAPQEAEQAASVAEPVAEPAPAQDDTAPEVSVAKELESSEPAAEPEVVEAPAQPTAEPEPEAPKKGMFARIKAGLTRTKANLTEQLGNLFLGKKEIDEELLEDIETLLLTADVGVEATTEIVSRLTDKVERNQLADAQALHQALKAELAELLYNVEQPLEIDTAHTPYVILMVGVNGVGKTTTIGKLTKRFQREGKSVMLAAGDTFRAAAVEQLQVWGERNNVPVVAQHTGADSASVLFDALNSAKSKQVDVLIADTAGRLQNKDHLMQELEKVVRVMRKIDASAPHEVMLVLDAGTGQNAMSQAKIFGDAVGVTGITLTKLDGTAKGGIIFAIAKQLGLPIRFIGVGEQVDDLRPFQAQEFVEALFDEETN